MSIQFGIQYFDGRPVDQGYLDKVSALISSYDSDDEGSFVGAGIAMLYRAFHTTSESRSGSQPWRSSSGAVLTWDGRLDNREQLLTDLSESLPSHATDAQIALAAYDRWSQACFPKLLGDWAVSIWDPNDKSLTLAKDFLGVRPLFYSIDETKVVWSTVLEPLVFLSDRSLELNKEYLAAWLSTWPPAHMTPYDRINSVPPCCTVFVKTKKTTTRQYWSLDPDLLLRYRSDAEYEDHFRSVLRKAVRVRLRSDRPVLAELSGGMDSSSIVCTADRLIEEGVALTPSVETLSCFDNTEPNWDERPYFERVEQQRGRTGFHIDVNEFRTTGASINQTFQPAPQFLSSRTPLAERVETYLRSRGIRVVLSGIGGDEALGGNPNPVPELADLLVSGRIGPLIRQSVQWALAKRRPVYQLIGDALRAFLPTRFCANRTSIGPPKWINPAFQRFDPRTPRLTLRGPRPTFQAGLAALEFLRRQIACSVTSTGVYEKRFPFLDRSLWEFVLAVPREQLLRADQRRSLMRRALSGIVPDEIRNRKRKAFISHAPFTDLLLNKDLFRERGNNLVLTSMGILNPQALMQAFENALHGKDGAAAPLLRLVAVERWLRSLQVGAHQGLSVHHPSRRPTLFAESDLDVTPGVKPINVLRNLYLAATIISASSGLTAAVDFRDRQRMRPEDAGYYHTQPPTEPLPPTLDPAQFQSDRIVYVAYRLASRMEPFLYQIPCYCPCRRMEGHESLLDCFVGKHGVKCVLCQKELFFCYRENHRGRPPARVREEIAGGKAWKLDLAKEANKLYRRGFAEH